MAVGVKSKTRNEEKEFDKYWQRWESYLRDACRSLDYPQIFLDTILPDIKVVLKSLHDGTKPEELIIGMCLETLNLKLQLASNGLLDADQGGTRPHRLN
jgi:hypothetical protein